MPHTELAAKAGYDYDMTASRTMTATWVAKPRQYLERYYNCHVHNKNSNFYIRRSFNGVCIVGIRSITDIPATVQTTTEKSTPTVELEMSLLGEKVSPGTMLCRINGEPIYAMIHGQLLELNTRLMDNPSLLVNDPTVEGFLAIILPKHKEEKLLQSFTTANEL